MENETFRKVECSKRLPNKGGKYDTDLGWLYLTSDRSKWRTKTGLGYIGVYYPDWWLEPIPPQKQMSESAIFEIILHKFPDYNVPYCIEVTAAIHDLVYGERREG